MRAPILLRILLPTLAALLSACAHAPADCDGRALARDELIAAVKDYMRSSGGSAAVIDNGQVDVRIGADGCDHIVRLAFKPPSTGDYATYAVTRDGRVRRVFRD